MNEFWNLVSRVEGLWNSPLRVEVLRILATTIFFVLGIVAGRLWGMWRRYRQLKMAERGESRGCRHDREDHPRSPTGRRRGFAHPVLRA